MPLTCNIDARGKRARLLGGIAVMAIAISLGAYAGVTGTRWAGVVAAALVAAGAFMVFEARAGWCVVRAMGFRTRI